MSINPSNPYLYLPLIEDPKNFSPIDSTAKFSANGAFSSKRKSDAMEEIAPGAKRRKICELDDQEAVVHRIAQKILIKEPFTYEEVKALFESPTEEALKLRWQLFANCPLEYVFKTPSWESIS